MNKPISQHPCLIANCPNEADLMVSDLDGSNQDFVCMPHYEEYFAPGEEPKPQKAM